MEIRQLNTFLKLASVLNFTQAGRDLGYSQPNVSMQIQQLEQEIGATLFNRIGRQVTLTQQGEQLLPYAQKIVSTAAKMENLLKTEEELTGTLRFGIVDTLNNWVIDRVLMRYHERFPKVKIEVSVDTAAVLRENLERGLLDTACLIDDPVPADKWNCVHRMEVPIVIAANRSSPLAQKQELMLADLREEEFILMEDSIAYCANFRNEMAKRGIEAQIAARIPSATLACRLVAQGNFLTVLPACIARLTRFHEELVILNVTDYRQMQYVQAICHPNKVLTPQVEGFLEALRVVIDDVLSS